MCVECGCEEAEERQCAVPQNVVQLAAGEAGEPAAMDEELAGAAAERELDQPLQKITVQL